MTVSFGCDHGGFTIRQDILDYLQSAGVQVIDHGTNSTQAVDYPEYAKLVCADVLSGKAEFGILICGTGVGISMTANKIHGIRCALVGDTFTAHATREHNNANVLAMGGRVVGPGLAADITNIFLHTAFSGEERHQNRIDKMMAVEK